MARSWIENDMLKAGLSLENRSIRYCGNLSKEDDDTDIINDTLEYTEAINEVDETNTALENAEEALDELQQADDEVAEAMGEDTRDVASEPVPESNVEVSIDSDKNIDITVAQEAISQVNRRLGRVSGLLKCKAISLPSLESVSTSTRKSLTLSREGIGDMAKSVWEFIKKLWGKIKDFFKKVWDKLKNIFTKYKKNLESMKSKIKGLKDGATRDKKLDENAIKSWEDNHLIVTIALNAGGFIGPMKNVNGAVEHINFRISDIEQLHANIKILMPKFKKTENDNNISELDKDSKEMKQCLIEDCKSSFSRMSNNYFFDSLKASIGPIELLELTTIAPTTYQINFLYKKEFEAWENDVEAKFPKIETSSINVTRDSFNFKLDVNKSFPLTVSAKAKTDLIKGLDMAIDNIKNVSSLGDYSNKLLGDSMIIFDKFQDLMNMIDENKEHKNVTLRQSQHIIKDCLMAHTRIAKLSLQAMAKTPVVYISEYLAYCTKFVNAYSLESSK